MEAGPNWGQTKAREGPGGPESTLAHPPVPSGGLPNFIKRGKTATPPKPALFQNLGSAATNIL